MNKTLVYFFYCRDDINERYKETFNLHLELIKQNIHIFNQSKFILAFDNLNNNSLIDSYKNYICDYLNLINNYNFVIVQNDPINREGIHFFNEIILKLDEYDGLLFFGHNKSDLNVHKLNIYDWITGIHFINFYDIQDIENKLLYDKYIAYGALPVYLNICQKIYEDINSKYIYQGSMFWLYPKKILYNYNGQLNLWKDFFNTGFNQEFIKSYNIQSLNSVFKYTAENFLDNISNFYEVCTTLNNIKPQPSYIFMKDNGVYAYFNDKLFSPYNEPITHYYLTDVQNQEFNDYFNNICNTLNISFD